MKCYTVNGEGIDHLRCEDRDDPSPPGLGEALVGVGAVSLNYRDLMVADGRYSGRMDRRIVACSDMAGVVLAVGRGVEGIEPGDRVLNAPFRRWPAGLLRSDWARTFVGGGGVDGVLAEKVVYPAESLVKVPAHLSMQEGSTLTIAGLTAWAALVTHGQTKPGEWVLLHGTGGVSLWAAQIAKTLGARVILSSSSSDKAKQVKERLGIDHTIDYRDPEWPGQVRELTGGYGADVVVEVGGGAMVGQSIEACAYGGRVGVIGVLGGAQATISAVKMIAHQVTVRGIFMESAAQLRAFAGAVESSGMRPWVDRVFPFEEVARAYGHLFSGDHMGKVVIDLSFNR